MNSIKLPSIPIRHRGTKSQDELPTLSMINPTSSINNLDNIQKMNRAEKVFI